MKLNDSSFLNSVNLSINEEKKSVKRIKSQKNILPKIKDYLNFSNSKVFKTTTINTSNNNSIINNKTFSKNLSEKNIIRNKINTKEFLQNSKKKKNYEKPPIPFNLFPKKFYITETNQTNNTNQTDNCNNNINPNLEKLKHIKFLPINQKNKKINNDKNIPIVDYLNKIREYNLMKFSVNMKKERVNKIINSKKSQINKLNETINSLKNVQEQFNNEFHIKYNQYLQYIERQIEDEKKINHLLLLQINHIKKELLFIESKIQKTQFEKEKMSKWFFLQIQVKEKFKDFPSYEKDIFDNYYINNDNDKNVKTHKIVIKKHRTTRKYYIEEIFKIKEYKNKIIFENADDFFFEFDKIAESILKKMKDLQLIKEEIEKIKKEKNDIQNEVIRKEKNESSKMNMTLGKLNMVKSIYNQNIKTKKELEKSKKNKSKIGKIINNNNINYTNKKLNDFITTKGALFHSLSSDCLHHHKNKEFISILHKKIYEIFEMTLNYGIHFKSIIENQSSLTTKIIDRNESKIISMLEFIENFFNILIQKYNIYKNDKKYSTKFKKAVLKVEDSNKHKKNLRQIELMKAKRYDVIEKIQKRMNKNYFLPFRRVENTFTTKINFETEKLSQKIKANSLTLYDFMYDIY